jgi:S1-C subfamily serine protease
MLAAIAFILVVTFLLTVDSNPDLFFKSHTKIDITDNIQSTVFIVNQIPNSEDAMVGTGIVIGSKYILTVSHLVNDKGDNNYTIVTYDGQKIKAKLLKVADSTVSNSKIDIALLELETPVKLPDPVIDCNLPKIETPVYTVGSPNGFPWMTTFGAVMLQKLNEFQTSLFGRNGAPDVYFLDIPAFHGNSGGALFDQTTGYVVGVVTSIFYWQDEFGKHPAPITMSQTPTNICKFLDTETQIKYKKIPDFSKT